MSDGPGGVEPATPVTFTQLVRDLQGQGAEATLSALRKVVWNLRSRPNDEKFRTLRLTNAAVARHLLPYDSAVRFLDELGFVHVDGYLSIGHADVQALAGDALAALDQAAPAPAQAPTPIPGVHQKSLVMHERPRVVRDQVHWRHVPSGKAVQQQLRTLKGTDSRGNIILVYGPPHVDKVSVCRAIATEYGMGQLHVPAAQICSSCSLSKASTIQHFVRYAADYEPCTLLLTGLGTFYSKAAMHARSSEHLPRVLILITADTPLEDERSLARGFGAQVPRSARARGSSVGGPNPPHTTDNLAHFDHLVLVPADDETLKVGAEPEEFKASPPRDSPERYPRSSPDTSPNGNDRQAAALGVRRERHHSKGRRLYVPS